MMKGDLPDTVPEYTAQMYLPKGTRITSYEWQYIVPNAYIWMDYFSGQ